MLEYKYFDKCDILNSYFSYIKLYFRIAIGIVLGKTASRASLRHEAKKQLLFQNVPAYNSCMALYFEPRSLTPSSTLLRMRSMKGIEVLTCGAGAARTFPQKERTRAILPPLRQDALPESTCLHCGLDAGQREHLNPADCIAALRERLSRWE